MEQSLHFSSNFCNSSYSLKCQLGQSTRATRAQNGADILIDLTGAENCCFLGNVASGVRHKTVMHCQICQEKARVQNLLYVPALKFVLVGVNLSSLTGYPWQCYILGVESMGRCIYTCMYMN